MTKNKFKQDPEVQAEIQRLYDYIDQYDRGQLVPWDEITNLIGHRHGRTDFDNVTFVNNRIMYIIKRARDRILAFRSIPTRTVNGVGIRLLTHEEATTRCSKDRTLKVYRQNKRAIKELETVDDQQIPIRLRALRHHQLQTFRNEQKRIRKSLKEINKETKSPIPPTRPILRPLERPIPGRS